MHGMTLARVALLANASFSLGCGLAFCLNGRVVAGLLLAGAPAAGGAVMTGLGVALLIFAVLVALVALSKRLTAKTVWALSASDVAWVLASLALLGADNALFTQAGVAAVAVVALAVLVFAMGQGLGATRMAAPSGSAG
ncbi:MAG: hypothetical protein ACHP7N_14875 [Caulobacterales bacterium]